MKWRWVIASVVLVAGCSAGEATPSTPPETVAIAAATTSPTTTPNSTTMPTNAVGATAAPETSSSPSTTAAPDAADDAEAEIIARYQAFSAAADACFAQPAACDLPNDLAQFANLDTDPVTSFTNYWTQLRDNNQRVTAADRIDRKVTSVKIDGETAVSTACVRNAAITVDADDNVVDERIGNWREDYVWALVEGTWMIQSGTATGAGGDAECTR